MFFVGIVVLNKSNFRKCIRGGCEWNSVIFWDGVFVGDFLIFKCIISMIICKELCCVNDLCELVLFVNGGCFFV